MYESTESILYKCAGAPKAAAPIHIHQVFYEAFRCRILLAVQKARQIHFEGKKLILRHDSRIDLRLSLSYLTEKFLAFYSGFTVHIIVIPSVNSLLWIYMLNWCTRFIFEYVCLLNHIEK